MRPQLHARALTTSALLTISTALVALPAEAGSQTPPPAEAAAGPVATKASSSVTVRSVRRHVVAGRRIVVRGVLRPAGAGRKVVLQVRAARRWKTVDRDRTNRRGVYRLTWRSKRPGTRRLRVRFAGDAALVGDGRAVGRVNIYRRAHASWYGPGLYGNKLACGGRLGAGTLGVAHKTLPCGTRLTLRLRGRSVRVRVIDRGPFVAGREFDLTAATKHRLRFGSTGTVMSTR